ncbi:MAG: methyltransferase [uncultured bacterium]|nr:MAG: methyltransferase [uncultured bacterium]
MEKDIANKILSETESGYDSIAEKFSQTRKHFWRELEFIKDYTHPGENVLDYGCGNGRLLELIGENNPNYQGVDVSARLIDLAKEKYPKQEFSKINPIQTTLPFNEGFFNTIYSIAVFHHFPSQKYRQAMANELYRVTKDGGQVIITVWYLWQAKYLKNILKNWKNKIFGKSKLDWNDCHISFTDNKGEKFSRFHHAWTKRELKKLFSEAGFKIERCDISDGRNILLIGKK